MIACVLDASVTCAWALNDDGSGVAGAALEHCQRAGARTPWIWWFEVRNILVMQERRGGLEAGESGAFLRQLQHLDIRQDIHPQESDLMGLARRHRLTVYDAAYLELALRLGAPLATLDRELAQAAKGEGVSLVR